MLMQEPTPEMIQTWMEIFEKYHVLMQPNRKTGVQLDVYFRNKYDYTVLQQKFFTEAVAANILENECFSVKCPEGKSPIVRTYRTGDVLVGIDLVSGYFQVECEEIEKAVPIYDDLFVYRGLDETDLTNFFLVAEYVRLTEEKC